MTHSSSVRPHTVAWNSFRSETTERLFMRFKKKRRENKQLDQLKNDRRLYLCKFHAYLVIRGEGLKFWRDGAFAFHLFLHCRQIGSAYNDRGAKICGCSWWPTLKDETNGNERGHSWQVITSSNPYTVHIYSLDNAEKCCKYLKDSKTHHFCSELHN